MLSFPASGGEDTDYTMIMSADEAAVVSNMLVVDEMVVVGSAVVVLVEAAMGKVVMGAAVVAETLIVIEGEEDMVAVGLAEMIGGADKVVGTSA